MTWTEVEKSDPRALELADRHYSRRSVGSPWFTPPGRSLVLIRPRAVWAVVDQEHVKHAWPGALLNVMFRLERDPLDPLASDLIREATWLTRWRFGEGRQLLTFVQPALVRSARPGACYLHAGWRKIGECGRPGKRRKIVLEAPPS